jgi:hypothetical protein
MFQQDFTKIYVMTNPNKKSKIIQQINNRELVSETVVGKKQEWWLKKHNPDNNIPKNIYSLGDGTIKELYDKYIIRYENIEWTEFINFTRELIKQQIML